jgi:hypothetical protein
MKGHGARLQGLKDSPDVELRTTGHTDMEVRETEANKLTNKLKDLLSRRWDPAGTRAFVDGIQYYVNRAARRQGEHLFKALYHLKITRLPCSTVVCVKKSGEDVAKWIKLRGKLSKEGI